MCMFALTVSIVEPKNIKEAMVDSAWIEAMQEELPSSPNMYKKYLAEFWYLAKALEKSKVSFLIPTGGIYGEVGVNTFRNSIGAHYLPHSSEYVTPLSIDIVRKWFESIRYGETVSVKGTLKSSLLPPRWRLLMAHIIWCFRGKLEVLIKLPTKMPLY
ncbi:hypothetical protein Tco_1174149 [Tanacetum coccineum]